MNLIPSNETISAAASSAWNSQPTNSGGLVTARSNWDCVDNGAVQTDPAGSQWLLAGGASSNANSNQSSNIQNSSSSNSSSSQLNSQPNQSGDLENNSSSPLMNEHNLPKNWSQVVDTTANNNPNNNSTSSSTNNPRDSPTQSLELTADQKAIKDAADKFTNVELYSDTWGNVPINQNTPWELPASQTNPNYQAPPREVHSFNGLIDNSWKYASSTTGTEIWEAAIRKKSATGEQLSPNELAGKQPMVNHIGGTWGEDDQMQSIQPSKMWNGPSNGLNSGTSLNNWMGENDTKQWSKQWNDAGMYLGYLGYFGLFRLSLPSC